MFLEDENVPLVLGGFKNSQFSWLTQIYID